jgi:hypothetical protein
VTHRRPTHGPRTALAECGELTVPVERKKGREEERAEDGGGVGGERTSFRTMFEQKAAYSSVVVAVSPTHYQLTDVLVKCLLSLLLIHIHRRNGSY